jgi:hypothetical protein
VDWQGFGTRVTLREMVGVVDEIPATVVMMRPIRRALPQWVRSLRRRKVLRTPIMLLFVVAVLLALPALVPYAFVCHYIDRRRLRIAAKSQACPSCGRILGIEALHLADERWRAHVAELHRSHPGVRFRLIRLVYAICLGCGAQLSFDKGAGTFEQMKVTD